MANEEPKHKIVVKDLWKSFGRLKVLTGLDLVVYEGETLVILGRSGVGKSVLLKQIIGIDLPDKGEIRIDDQDIYSLSPKERTEIHKNMGMLFQGAALFDSLNVGENTGFYLNQHADPATGKKLTKDEIQQRSAEALELVDLAGVEPKMPSDLSGGMRKRAGLARLIAYRPSIMLYDEPTTGLDPITAMQINELILKTQQELKATSIVVTHDIRSALTVGTRIALHHEGKIQHIAPKEQFFKIDDPVIQQFYRNAKFSPEEIDGRPN